MNLETLLVTWDAHANLFYCLSYGAMWIERSHRQRNNKCFLYNAIVAIDFVCLFVFFKLAVSECI